MSKDFLSQEEVDSLLKGVTGEADESDKPAEQEGGIKPYNLATQERIVRGRMPTMEIINERFARNARVGLFNLIRKSPEVSIGGIKVQKYSAFLREIVVPTNFNIVAIKPLRGAGLVFFAYIGFDAVSTAAEETRNPQRDMPIAMIASLVICTVIYVLVALVLTGMVPYGKINIDAPVADAFAQAGLPFMQFLISAGALAGMPVTTSPSSTRRRRPCA